MAEYKMRQFDSGATRDQDTDKFDYEGFLDPAVLQRYAEYMHKNRVQANGNIRASDNWTLGISMDAYMKSLYRHHQDVHLRHRGHATPLGQEDNLCAVIFNAMGYLHELLKQRHRQPLEQADGFSS